MYKSKGSMKSLMEKTLGLVAVCLFMLPTTISSQNAPHLSGPQCVSMNGGGSVTLEGDVDEILGWSGRGDVSVSKSPGESTVSFSSTGYGKGCITVKYMAKESDSCSCASSASIDVYKSFNLPDTIGIEGPTCVSPGQTVVFSIDPIVTKNINDRIGIDSYYWNVDTLVGKYNSFVESVHYSSGDSSSVTFTVKDWDDNIGPNEISVIVGKCNKYNEGAKRSLTLMKQAPKPDFGFDHLCIPYGQTPFTLSILNASSNVEYMWEKSPDWEFLEFNADSTSVTVRPDVDSPDTIAVSAVYKNNKGIECATTRKVLHIYRNWGNTVNIEGPKCTYANGGPYRYSVKGNVPRKTKVRWEFPDTWTVTGELTNQYVDAYPGPNAALTNEIRVYESSQCGSTGRYVSYLVNVKPASVNITGEQCVNTDTTYIYTITRKQDALGPDVQQYALYINGYFKRNFAADTVSVTIADTIRFMQVQPLGNEGCNGDFSDTLTLMINPTPPASIIWEDNHCIAAGMEDSVTLSVSNAVASQTYTWDYITQTHNWRLKRYPTDNHSEIVLYTTGQAGKDTISVYAEGSGICNNKDTVEIVIETAAVPFSIQIDDRASYYDFYSVPISLQTLPEFEQEDSLYYVWAINGESSNDWVGYDATDFSQRKSRLSTSDTVSLTVETKSGCIYNYSTAIGDAIVPEIQYNINYKSRMNGINKNIEQNFNIRPNPANSHLAIELPETQGSSVIKICDMSGKMIKRFKTSESSLTIPTNSLSEAVYVILLYQEGRVLSKQFIVKH